MTRNAWHYVARLPTPDNLDPAHVARVTALLDAFMAVGNGYLSLHEIGIEHLPYIAWSWAQDRGHRISVRPFVRSDGGARESWDIGPIGSQISIFPIEIGLLSERGDDVKERIAEIQRDAAERIKQLLNGEMQ